ncbi:MAG: DivIVA domain-containing protein [Clostridiaceae bacterium]|nr:DivIVA domain-containing protein [Clostridiaceae bacterium]
MNFLPNDLQNIAFKRAIGGYNMLQVEDVILKVVEDLSELIKENNKLKEKLEESQERVRYYRGIEDKLHNSLIVAQQTSDEIVANARDAADNMKKEAELTSQQIVDQAHKEILSVKFEYERLRRDLTAYKCKVESIIKSQLKLMDCIDDEQLVESLDSTFDTDFNLAEELEKEVQDKPVSLSRA